MTRLYDWIYRESIINELGRRGFINKVRELQAAIPLRIDLGSRYGYKPSEYIGIDKEPGPNVSKVWDLEKGLPYPDDVADEIRAYHILEHLPDSIKTMSEIWRVLKDGGILRFEIPSTKGEGADADPTHKSRWNSLSFAFYTDDELRESHDIPCKFDLVSIEEEEDLETGAVYVRGILRARKSGRYAPSESVAPHFFALRDGVSKDIQSIEQGKQSASQSISAADQDALGLAPFSEQIMKDTPTPIEGPGDENFNFMIRDCFGANPPSAAVTELRRMWNDYLIGWEQYYLENMANRNVRDNFVGIFFDSSEVTAIIKQWPNNWYEEEKLGKDVRTPKELVDSVLEIYKEEIGPYFGNGFDYWTHYYLTLEDLEERDKKLRKWLETTDFKSVAIQILKSGGGWSQLRNEIERLGTESIREFDQELERRAHERAAKDPARREVLGPVEYKVPPGATPEWARIAKMKKGLAEDPMMREIEEEFGPQGTRPFYQAVEGAVLGLVRVENCSGYYGGLDAAGVPFFITAAHCMHDSDPVAITLPNRNMLIATPTQTREDIVLLRIAPKDTAYVTETMKPLSLAEEYSGYGLMLGSRYDEAELVHRREGRFWPARIKEFVEIERARGGYSGGPLVNTRGEVMGILSTCQTREGRGLMYPSRTLGFESYELLRELYKQAGIPWPLTGGEIPEDASQAGPPPVDEAMKAEELTRQLLSEINWADIAFYSGTGNPRVRVSPSAERILEPTDYETSVREEVLGQDWVPLIQEIMGRTKDKTEISERFQRKLRIYVRNSTELARNLDAMAKERDPMEYAWLGRMEYTQPPGATEEWFDTAKAKASLAQDPMMLEIQEEFGPEGVNVFNEAIDKVVSGLVDVSGCSGYYGGVTSTGVPFFITATHCVRKGRVVGKIEKTLVTLPSGEVVKLTPGVAHEDTQILFAENPQEAATIAKTNTPLRLGTEPSGWVLALGTHFNEAELLRSIGERYEGYASIFNKAEDVYEELHRYRGGYSGGPIINSNGEVIGLSSGQYFVGGKTPRTFAAYSSLETLRELYRLNGIPLPEYLGGARKKEMDGLYIVQRHADLIVSGEKKIIIKSKKLPIAERKLYLICENEVLGEIELEEPEQIDEKRFNELRIQHLVTNEERDEWWKDAKRFWAYKIKKFKAFKPPKKYERKQGVQTIQKDIIPLAAATKLTEKGEQPGNERLDWMAAEPSKIPVKGTLWTHTRGIDPAHKDLGYDGMMKLSTKDDVLNLHHDVRFLWQARYLEGFTLFLGNQEDKDKLLKYDGGKLGASIKQKQPPIWGDPKELDNRLFPPGEVGNVSGKDTWGAMFLVDRVSLLPSRMRSKPKGKRYFEFALAFKKHKELNGLWCITEEAGAEYELPFMMFRLQENVPFWLRRKKKHEKEIEEETPKWQKPTQEAIDEFVKE